MVMVARLVMAGSLIPAGDDGKGRPYQLRTRKGRAEREQSMTGHNAMAGILALAAGFISFTPRGSAVRICRRYQPSRLTGFGSASQPSRR